MSRRYSYFILCSYDQNLNSPKYGAQTFISEPSIEVNTKLWITFNICNICKYIVISSLIFCVQIVCEFYFFNKLLVILEFSQHQ